MQRTTLFTAVVTAVVFAAGGWLVASKTAKVGIARHVHGSQDCRGHGTCNIDVKVDSCDPAHPDPATCDVYAVQELTLVGRDNDKLDFKIATNGFKFDQSDGIKFTALNSGDQYFPCAPQGQQYRCQIMIPTGTTSSFKYVIHVQNLDPVDPWVVNN